MSRDGKDLEQLVALIEKVHLPPGVEITTNRQVRDEAGVPIAEFDIEIKGKLGTTEIAWLIECRDRPSDGPASGSWIEQLVGRRDRFGFNKVTAVSTTGFAVGALDYAREKGIETREVRSLKPEAFADWLVIKSITTAGRSLHLISSSLIVDAKEAKERQAALLVAITGKTVQDKLLRAIDTGETVSTLEALSGAASGSPQTFEGVTPNQPAKTTDIRAAYSNDESHFVVDTEMGAVRIREIHFTVEVSLHETKVPLLDVTEYMHSPSGKSISQSAAFVFEAMNTKLSLEMHKLTGSSGETRIVLRNLGVSKSM